MNGLAKLYGIPNYGFHPQTSGGLPPSQFPSVQTGGGYAPRLAPAPNTSGGLPPQSIGPVHTGGGFAPIPTMGIQPPQGDPPMEAFPQAHTAGGLPPMQHRPFEQWLTRHADQPRYMGGLFGHWMMP